MNLWIEIDPPPLVSTFRKDHLFWLRHPFLIKLCPHNRVTHGCGTYIKRELIHHVNFFHFRAKLCIQNWISRDQNPLLRGPFSHFSSLENDFPVVKSAGVSKSRYISISILIKYSNFSRFYKKLGPFYKKLRCDKFGN